MLKKIVIYQVSVPDVIGEDVILNPSSNLGTRSTKALVELWGFSTWARFLRQEWPERSRRGSR